VCYVCTCVYSGCVYVRYVHMEGSGCLCVEYVYMYTAVIKRQQQQQWVYICYVHMESRGCVCVVYVHVYTVTY